MGLDSSKRNLLYLQLSINIQLYSSCYNGYLSIQNIFRFPQVLWCYIFKSRREEKKILYTASLRAPFNLVLTAKAPSLATVKAALWIYEDVTSS